MRLLIVCIFCALLASLGFPQREKAKIMTWKDYSRLSPKWPYALKLNRARGRLLYYGVSHTNKPEDAQLAEIEKLWVDFRPDIAFNEGGNPPIERSRNEAIRNYGEAGLIRFLAARDKVPVASIDPSRAEEVAFLSKTFSPEPVKLFFVLRVVAQHVRNRGVDTLGQELERVFPIFGDTPGLKVAPNSIAELEVSYARHFTNQGSYKDARLSWYDPTKSETFLNDISRRSSEYRDRYMVELLARHVKDGQRVFAVVGGSHVIMQERAIRKLLR